MRDQPGLEPASGAGGDAHDAFPASGSAAAAAADRGLIETCVHSETVHRGAFLNMRCDTVLLPDGKQAIREYITHPGAVMILPVFDDGRVLVERQFRYPVGQVMIEYPAGKLDPQEGALACGIRELREETGYVAREYAFMTRIHPVISYSNEFIDLYVARGLTAGQAALDDGEFLETHVVELAQMLEWIAQGVISDVKTIIATFWLDRYTRGESRLDFKPAPH
ncbi:MAG: NUDIX domain-containing protein [Janthinobacterium lividum]